MIDGLGLAGFLEDRIAEDEELARDGRPADARARLLADCAARRLIVADYRAAANAHREGWDTRSPRDYPLRALSLSWAGHPDYQPGWRP